MQLRRSQYQNSRQQTLFVLGTVHYSLIDLDMRSDNFVLGDHIFAKNNTFLDYLDFYTSDTLDSNQRSRDYLDFNTVHENYLDIHIRSSTKATMTSSTSVTCSIHFSYVIWFLFINIF